jgi:hypothetical protein
VAERDASVSRSLAALDRVKRAALADAGFQSAMHYTNELQGQEAAAAMGSAKASKRTHPVERRFFCDPATSYVPPRGALSAHEEKAAAKWIPGRQTRSRERVTQLREKYPHRFVRPFSLPWAARVNAWIKDHRIGSGEGALRQRKVNCAT